MVTATKIISSSAHIHGSGGSTAHTLSMVTQVGGSPPLKTKNDSHVVSAICSLSRISFHESNKSFIVFFALFLLGLGSTFSSRDSIEWSRGPDVSLPRGG